MRSAQGTTQNSAKLLEHDIRNSVHHIFEKHTHCSDFCKAKSTTLNSNPNLQQQNRDALNFDQKENEIADVIQQTVDMWNETTSLEAEEESRGEAHYYCDLESMMLQDISILLDRIASKSRRLLGNFTTNLAECWMAIRAKFDGGKFYNRCNRGSWHSRCYGSCLWMNLGPQWSTVVWEKCTSSTSGRFFNQLYERRDKSLMSSNKCKMKKESKARRWKRKCQSAKESSSKKARVEYGPDVPDSVEDISANDLEQKKKDFLAKHVNLSENQLKVIEQGTRKQSQSSVWLNERKKRITSSNFGTIIKKDPSKPVAKLVQRLLYSKFKGNFHTRKGLQEESMTIIEYKNWQKSVHNKTVHHFPMGLVTCKENKFLAASPDRKIVEEGGGTGLIEIKNLLHNKPINLHEAVECVPNFCLQLVGKSLKLKNTHDYYYQIQGQLNITHFPWLDFVVRTLYPYQLHKERIESNTQLWKNDMLPKLSAFYHKAILPELAAPRNETTSGIREPGQWVSSFHFDIKSMKRTGIKYINFPSDSFAKQVHVTDTKKKVKILKKGQTKANSNVDTPIAPTPGTSGSKSSVCTRSRRPTKVKFKDRRISHEWIEDIKSNKRKWYSGTVTGVISGKDGEISTVYEVLYDGDDEPYEIGHLYEDYMSSSVKFIDL